MLDEIQHAPALPGRINRIELWPVARSEIEGGELNGIDELLAGRPPQVTSATAGPDAYATAISEGGYPEARIRPAGRLRNRWSRDYLAGTLGKDLLELADLRRADDADRLLRLIASQSANLLSFRKIAQQLELDDKTVKEHTLLLEQLFLVRRHPGWRPGLGAGEIAAIEIKAAATLNRRDRRWLEHLRYMRPDTFKAGIIIQAGAHTTPLGDRLWAVPFSGLWT